MKKQKHEQAGCPIDLVLHVIGSKWTIPIVRDLLISARRPSELSKSLDGINPKTLTDRLRDLERWGIVKRTAFQEIPPRVEYSLTEKGRELKCVVEALREVGERWRADFNGTKSNHYKDCSHCAEYLNGDDGGCPVARESSEQPSLDGSPL
ncbi:MAG TPA: helix-turn-helix domain-containing protein [Candidatus Obscuribacterales bacterium]